MTVLERFPPLQGAIAQAESWQQFFNVQRRAAGPPRPEELTPHLENIVWVGVHLGEALPFTWRLTFATVFRPGAASWSSVTEYETLRQEARRLFFTSRAALEMIRQEAEALHLVTGQSAIGMDRLLRAIEAARQLEETVFRDWPSFTEPLSALQTTDSLPVAESLAEALGISVDLARQKMETRQRELHPGQE